MTPAASRVTTVDVVLCCVDEGLTLWSVSVQASRVFVPASLISTSSRHRLAPRLCQQPSTHRRLRHPLLNFLAPCLCSVLEHARSNADCLLTLSYARLDQNFKALIFFVIVLFQAAVFIVFDDVPRVVCFQNTRVLRVERQEIF